MVKYFHNFNNETVVLISLAIILFFGFLVTRLTKLVKLPNVSGYIIAGVLIGPYVLGFVPSESVQSMNFISDIALAFVAFEVGKFFKLEIIKQMGLKTVAITVCECALAGLLVTCFMHFVFSFSWSFSLLLGAIATATAPTSTMMTIRQYHARGEFVNTLLQTIALDGVISLFAFSVVTGVISSGSDGSRLELWTVAEPLLYNILAIVVGFLCGYVLSKLITPARSTDNRLILAIAMLLSLSGLCAMVDISPLLACMMLGASYINLTHDKELYRQMNAFTPPIMSLFFIVSGMNLNIPSLGSYGLISVSYFALRLAGKYLGSFIGGAVTKSSACIRKYLGLALIPQAGVAIGLAFLGQRMLPESEGTVFMSIILASSMLYELVGPACAKYALFSSGTIQSRIDVSTPDMAVGQADNSVKQGDKVSTK